jgi:hypothetical protein
VCVAPQRNTMCLCQSVYACINVHLLP